MDKKYYQKMWHEIQSKGFFQGQITDRRKDGTNYTVWQKICLLKDPKTGEVTNYVAMSQDISELLEKQNEVEHLAYYDGLTNLLNRSYFLQITNKILKTHTTEHFALLHIDFDNFKEINEALGHKAGDMLLRKFAAYLQENLVKKDIAARLNGDEFAVMATNVKGPEEAYELGCKIQEFSKKVELRQELKNAIVNNELTLYYQPKYSMKEKRVVGFEALIRWIHPAKGFVGPDMFIPIAEESGLIVDMTNWIFQEVNKTLLDFKAIYKENFSIAVNISAKHFKEESLIEKINSSIDEKLISEGYLELEVTESAFMNDVALAKKQLEILNNMGISISLDDFGTGHSSLAYLKNLPVSTLKVDKSFVDGLCTDEKDYAIVKSTIELARSLGMTTTIEGVEDQDQLDKLQHMNADYIQGYVYSRPLKKEDAIELLKTTDLSL